jgi:hypothetical protein
MLSGHTSFKKQKKLLSTNQPRVSGRCCSLFFLPFLRAGWMPEVEEDGRTGRQPSPVDN